MILASWPLETITNIEHEVTREEGKAQEDESIV